MTGVELFHRYKSHGGRESGQRFGQWFLNTYFPKMYKPDIYYESNVQFVARFIDNLIADGWEVRKAGGE